MDTGTNPEALTQDDVQLLTELADYMEADGAPHMAAGLRDMVRRIAASLEAAS